MGTTTERLQLPGGDLETRLSERGLGVTLEGSCDLEIELHPWVRVTQRGDDGGFWDLTARAFGPDPFHLFLQHIEARLAPHGEPSPATTTLLLLRAQALLQRVSAGGAASCDPIARNAALAFGPRRRFALYAHFANDRTGRLLQAARTVPGALLVLEVALYAAGPFASAGAALLHDLCVGRRLTPTLDEVTQRLQRLPRLRFPREPGPEMPPHVVPRAAHRQLIRRAGPETDAWFLAQPPPFPIVPEEIPRELDGRRAWYALAAFHGAWFREESPGPQDFRLAAFFSRHATALGRYAKRYGGIRSLAAVLISRDRPRGRAPCARSDPAEVLAAVERERLEHEAFEHGRASAEVAAHGGYPAPPFPADQRAAWEVRPISSLEELREEGRRQRNCALTWFDRVLLGESAFYSARLGPRRLTLVISRRPGEPWRLGQVVAYANAPATAVERRVLERWLAKVGAGQEAQVSGTARGDDAAPHRKCSHGAVFGAPVPNERGKPTGR